MKDECETVTWEAKGVTDAYLPSLLRTGLVKMVEAQDSMPYFKGDERLAFELNPLGDLFVKVMNDTF